MNPWIETNLDRGRIEDFCRRWRIAKLELFGSVLRDDFRPDSDVDMLVTFDPEARWNLWDRVRMRDELAGIAGRPVDLLSRSAVAASSNWIRRKAILESATVLYGSQ